MLARIAAVGVLLALGACAGSSRGPAVSKPAASTPARPDAASVSRNKGGYYLDDGPMDASGINLDALPDAVPTVEPLHRFANRPYNVFGQDYVPQQAIDVPFQQTGVGSWYGRKFHGQRTSSGEIYDMFAMTAAHPTLPIPSYARVTHVRSGRQVIVRVNDRGPFLHNRVIDLSYAAAHRLGYVNQGSAEVTVEKLTPTLIAQLRDSRSAPPPALAASTPPSAPQPVVSPLVNPLPVAQQAGLSQPVLPQSAVQQSVVPQLDASPPGSGMVAAANEAAQSAFFLQLGAFSVEDNAKSFLSRLTLEFSDHLPNLQIVRREPLFRLLAGPYRSREEAQLASRRLKDLTAIASVVVTP